MQEFATFERPEVSKEFSFDSLTALVTGSNRFALDLWRHVRTEHENGAVAPASLTMALAMLWAGARGDTANEIARSLHLEGQHGIHDAAAHVLRDWSDPGRTDYVLRVVNRLFGDRAYPFETAYLDFVRQRYGAPLEPLDFRQAPEASRERINRWVEEQTSRRIRDLLPPGSVGVDTGMVLANAVYFLGRWQNPFEPERTIPAPFFPARSEPVKVPTMRQESEFGYAEVDGVQLLEMSYRPARLAMTILLPSTRDGLGELERRLDVEMLQGWLKRLETRPVVVSLPRFRIAPPQPIALSSALSAMGLRRAFSQRSADFTAIADPEDPAKRLFLEAAFQKVFVEVDERGTEAAAATAFMMAGAALDPLPPPRPKRFVADRPFLFLLRDTSGGMILFVGHVANPEA